MWHLTGVLAGRPAFATCNTLRARVPMHTHPLQPDGLEGPAALALEEARVGEEAAGQQCVAGQGGNARIQAVQLVHPLVAGALQVGQGPQGSAVPALQHAQRPLQAQLVIRQALQLLLGGGSHWGLVEC